MCLQLCRSAPAGSCHVPGLVIIYIKGPDANTQVYDPPASLSADRRGTLTLPDAECGYDAAALRAYTPKVRAHTPKMLYLAESSRI